MGSREESLFRKLRDTDTPKCRAFLEDYLELRRLSTVLPPDELLRTIYEKTGYTAIVGAMRGVGGIDTWMTDVEEAYRIPSDKDIAYKFMIKRR